MVACHAGTPSGPLVVSIVAASIDSICHRVTKLVLEYDSRPRTQSRS